MHMGRFNQVKLTSCERQKEQHWQGLAGGGSDLERHRIKLHAMHKLAGCGAQTCACACVRAQSSAIWTCSCRHRGPRRRSFQLATSVWRCPTQLLARSPACMARWSTCRTGLLVATLAALAAAPCLHAEEPQLDVGRFAFADIEALYQMYDNPAEDAGVVMFLHGEQDTSDTWVELGTMKDLRSSGYRVVAVDLPGHGKSRRLPYLDNNMRAEFVKAALEFAAKGANITKIGAVLVTPSISGNWAIPFLDRYGTMLRGWVAVSPSGVSKWGGPWEDTHKKVRLLAVYGLTDEKKSQADNLLKLFSRSSKLMVPEAGEACYKEKPDFFHRHLKGFIKESFRVD